MDNPNIFKIAREKYKKYGLWGFILILAGVLIQDRVIRFLNETIDSVFIFLVELLTNTQLQNVFGYFLIVIGFLLLFLMFLRAQNDINLRLEQIKSHYEGGGLQILKIFENWSEHENYKHIHVIIRNGQNTPLLISGEISPILYQGYEDEKWHETEYKRSVSFSSEIKIDPKKTLRLSLARAEKELDSFFLHCGINNPYLLKDIGSYKYTLSLKGIDEDNKKKYHVSIEGRFVYSGGAQLSFIESTAA